MKIDIEGGEVACLRGATRVLKHFRPFISVEYGRPSYSAYGLTARSLYDTAEIARLCDCGSVWRNLS